MTILVDMDDTIENLLDAWISYLNGRYGTNVSAEDIRCWDMSKSFPNLTEQQIMSPMLDDGFWDGVKPKEGAADMLKRLMSEGHRVFIVTASCYKTIPSKMDAVLFRHFPFLTWDNVIITSNKQMIKGDVLIDDGVHNLVGGDYIKVLMDAPHNQGYPAQENGMFRVKDWNEIYSIISRIKEVKSRLNVILYSTGCPKCKVLKQKLDNQNIPYSVCDSVDDMMALGIMQAPVLSVNGELYDFCRANEWVNHYQTWEETRL